MNIKKLLEDAKARKYSAESAFNTADEKLKKASKSQNGDNPIVGDELKAIMANSEATMGLYELANKEVKRYEKAVMEAEKPVLPGSLPTDTQDPLPVEGSLSPQQKAVYVARYGEPNKALEAIATGVYGKNIQQDRYIQHRNFASFVHGNKAADTTFAHTYIPTEGQIQDALRKGQSVETFKAIITEASDISAAFLIPADTEQQIISREPGLSVMSGRAKTNDTIRDSKKYIKRTGGDGQFIGNVRFSWVNETPDPANLEEEPTYQEETIFVHTGMAISKVSKNLVDDSAYDISSELTEEWGTAVAIGKDNAFVAGNGSGKPQGMFLGNDAINVANGINIVESSGGSITFDALVEIAQAGIGTQYRQGFRSVPGVSSVVNGQVVTGQETMAGWLANKQTYADIAKLKAAGSGTYHWKEERGNNAAGTPLTLLGYTVWEQEIMVNQAIGNHPMIFGNLGGYEILNRLGMGIEFYNVKPGSNFVEYELKFRVGGQVSRPWMLSALKVVA